MASNDEVLRIYGMPTFDAHKAALQSIWTQLYPGREFPLTWEDLNNKRKLAAFCRAAENEFESREAYEAREPPEDYYTVGPPAAAGTTNKDNAKADKDYNRSEISDEGSDYDPQEGSKKAGQKKTVKKGKGKQRKKTADVVPQKNTRSKANKESSRRSSPDVSESTLVVNTPESFAPSPTLVDASHSSTSSSPEPANAVTNPPSRLGKRQRSTLDDNDNDSSSPLPKVPKNVSIKVIKKGGEYDNYFIRLSKAYPLTSAAKNDCFVIQNTPLDKARMRWECPLDESCKSEGQMSYDGLRDHCNEKHPSGSCPEQRHWKGSKGSSSARLSAGLRDHIIQVHYGNDKFCCPSCSYKTADRIGSLVKHMVTCRAMKDEEKELSVKKEVDEESKTESGEGEVTDVDKGSDSDKSTKNVVSKVDASSKAV